MTAVMDVATEARRVWEPALRAAVGRLDARVRPVVEHHFGWTDGTGPAVPPAVVPPAAVPPAVVPPAGKALRPALALLSARAVGGPPGSGIAPAVAIELVHNFSLLQDDVMDGDAERRHRPAAWAVFGAGPAILAGDALLTLAADVLDEEDTPGAHAARRCLAVCTHRLIAGQAADLELAGAVDVALDRCLATAADKTGSLFGCAASIGALWAGAPAPVVSGLRSFGEHLGLAFQLVDDLLGIWGSPQRTGKPVLADLAARKRSVPVVAALRSGTSAGRELATLYADPDAVDAASLARAARLVEDAGGRSWTEREAGRLLERACAELDRTEVVPEVAGALAELCHSSGVRDR